MASTSTIILEYIIPIIGTILSNLQYLAPVRDLHIAVKNGSGLNSLNPTPWAFMMGKGLGWTGYGILTNNWFAFLSECPGFLIGLWLNIGAIKLLYLSHHKNEIKESLVLFLAEGGADRLDPSVSKSCDSDSDIEEGITGDLKKEDASKQQRSETLRRWGEIVWNVTSRKTPAKIPHEYLVVFMIIVWVVIFSALGFSDHPNKDLGPIVTGFCSNLNQIFFYGAPLSRIWTVLSTKSSDTLHFPTMLFNTLNAALWFIWAFFGINDIFIYVPSGLGLFFGTVQFALWMIFPKSKKWLALQQTAAEDSRPSLAMMVSPEFLATVLPGYNDETDIDESFNTHIVANIDDSDNDDDDDDNTEEDHGIPGVESVTGTVTRSMTTRLSSDLWVKSFNNNTVTNIDDDDDDDDVKEDLVTRSMPTRLSSDL